MEQAMRQEFEYRFPIPEGIEWRDTDYFPVQTDNVHVYVALAGVAARYTSMWQAWQASRAALRVELPPTITAEEVVEHFNIDEEGIDMAAGIAHMVNGAIWSCAAFIQQAGIEVKQNG
ncbi:MULTISPECIES: hypothetical protein [Pseudomonas aeruginosa group]|uniref:Uncharacterized protein n=1 Tax=Pseudomonas paraeruginosa TaxID=2994495 RepID=A0A2R3J1G6_9PSED|nr:MULTISPECIES: hypothetical protein [Pseudomonas aeruginosa group]AVK08019.1 hypothetical protein CSB93_4836 [Pseudomonas paraeruginosa]MCT9628177.1 hypothetical protein [Pseudomonas aeruginosa]MCW8035470.1 hypothetical protein [Pseudomonas aeruginosa]